MTKNIKIRESQDGDLPSIINLFSDDILGSSREVLSEDAAAGYYKAFYEISRDKNNLLLVAEIEGIVKGVLQVIFIYNLSFNGSLRAIVEGVHVDKNMRSMGIGKFMMEWVIVEARKRGCRFIQLTSNKQRKDAHRFYENMGFVASHEGFKLDLASI